MRTAHVILRRTVVSSTEKGLRARAAEVDPVAVIELDDLTSRRVAEVRKLRDVDGVAPVMPMKLIEPVSRPDSPEPVADGATWGLCAVAADASPFDGDGTTVAILDTGVDPTHTAFQGITLERKNFTKETDDDTNGHGTHCAGTIFGRDIDGIRIGVARGVTKALVGKVLGIGGGASDLLLMAINWALSNGANVVSMSLGIDFPGFVASLIKRDVPPELATSMGLEAYRDNVLLFESLARLVKERGQFQPPCLLIAAAGNESRVEQDPDFVIGVSPPAVANGVISVAALGQGPHGFTVAPFSNVGARVSGPGVGVLSAKLGGGLIQKNGTSMATPHVAGVAALWAQKLRSAKQFRSQLFVDRLVGSATLQSLAPGFDPSSVGAGMVRAPVE